MWAFVCSDVGRRGNGPPLDKRGATLPCGSLQFVPQTRRTFSYEGFRIRSSEHDGETVGNRYTLAGLLDQGGMCDIFLARDNALERLVALKRLRPHLGSAADMHAHLVAEARASMAVHHPGVIHVHAVESPEGGEPFIIMEALQGESLSEYLRREPLMPQERALRLGRQLASALAAAHRAGIVHRDVKPGNLFLVGGSSAPEQVKLIDFGLALDSSRPGGCRTGRSFVVGTAQYMAPEQVLADPIDARTDVYAFGVVLFRCVTGHLPFDLDPGTDLLGHQIFSPAPPPSWLREGLDPRLEELILRCMRKHPANRYQSMEAVLGDLEIVAASLGSSRGAPISRLRQERLPDVYSPKHPRGRDAADYLAQEFGTAPSPSASVLPSSYMMTACGHECAHESQY